MVQSESFQASCSWWSEGLFGQSFSIALPIQALRGLPCLGSFSVVPHIRHKERPQWLGSSSVDHCLRHLMGHPLDCSAANAGLWGERGYGNGSTRYVWLRSITLLPWLPDFPSQAFPTTVSFTSHRSISPHWTAALTLGLPHNSWTPCPSLCTFQRTCIPVQGMYSCGKDCLILMPFRLPQISWFSLSLKCFFCDSDSAWCGDWNPASVPTCLRADLILLTLLFFLLVPLSYWILHGSIYYFPLVRYSCPLSEGVLPVLLCLKVYSWYIYEERCTPHPPTPLPSCSV